MGLSFCVSFFLSLSRRKVTAVDGSKLRFLFLLLSRFLSSYLSNTFAVCFHRGDGGCTRGKRGKGEGGEGKEGRAYEGVGEQSVRRRARREI